MPLPKSKFGKASIFVRKIFSESTSLSLPVEAIFDLDCHYIPPYDANSFLLYITNYLKRKNLNIEYKIEIVQRKTPYLPAYQTSLNQKLVKQLLHLYKKEIGNYSISFGLTVADENIISFAGTPVITIGLLGGNPHSSLEWVDKKDYLLLFEKMPKIVQGLLDS
jgi:acetylornithine deacetylase/succinyl-diaminopimelate desuccinylase-like protein